MLTSTTSGRDASTPAGSDQTDMYTTKVAHLWRKSNAAQMWTLMGRNMLLLAVCNQTVTQHDPTLARSAYLDYFWLTHGNILAKLWPSTGKERKTALVQSFQAECGPNQSVTCARSRPQIFLLRISVAFKKKQTVSLFNGIRQPTVSMESVNS